MKGMFTESHHTKVQNTSPGIAITSKI